MNIKWPKISQDKNREAKGIVPTTEFIRSITIYWVSDAIVGRIFLFKNDSGKSGQVCHHVKFNSDEVFMKYIIPRSTVHVGAFLRPSY